MDNKTVNKAKTPASVITQPGSKRKSNKVGNVRDFPYSVREAGQEAKKEIIVEDPTLVVSADRAHSDVRRQILEQAGFKVVAVTDLRSLMEACKTQAFSLAIIGYSIPAAEKARIAQEMKHCLKDIPTLELHEGSDPDLSAVTFSFLQSAASEPDAFLETVRSIRNGSYKVQRRTGT
ncbi:MAG TPA: hypothetical protein VM056_07220 [Terriglobales bacterium]|nr:hypothetical protein [Terriglobales bacterium]